jgi:hypothetical protein
MSLIFKKRRLVYYSPSFKQFSCFLLLDKKHKKNMKPKETGFIILVALNALILISLVLSRIDHSCELAGRTELSLKSDIVRELVVTHPAVTFRLNQ